MDSFSALGTADQDAVASDISDRGAILLRDVSSWHALAAPGAGGPTDDEVVLAFADFPAVRAYVTARPGDASRATGAYLWEPPAVAAAFRAAAARPGTRVAFVTTSGIADVADPLAVADRVDSDASLSLDSLDSLDALLHAATPVHTWDLEE